jgi:pyridoxamine 5'-phosphate oxidase
MASMNEINPQQLTQGDFTAAPEPFELFNEWFAEAQAKEINDPNAMALATSDAAGLPNLRMVLLKDVDQGGFVFYTNDESAKGRELAHNNQAALLFHWKSLRRQVRLRGPVTKVSAAEADAYFHSRPLQSRLGAWASKQSRPLESRFALEKAVAKLALQYTLGEVPRPPYWNGYRLKPLYFEFWKDGAFRLHDRIAFRRDAPAGAWVKERLYP